MRDGNQLERMYAVSFKVLSGDQLEDEKDEDEKKISRRFEGGQMLLPCFLVHSHLSRVGRFDGSWKTSLLSRHWR